MKSPTTLISTLSVILGCTQADDVSNALSATPTASIINGQIVGTTTSIAGPTGGIAVNKFLGVPFAAQPVGSLRFAPPRAPEKWDSSKTITIKPACVQAFAPFNLRNLTMSVFNNPAPEEDEDCLYLNVFAPKKAWDPASPPYPVLYWMYGGGWKFGNAGQPMYDGSHFAALEDVIVVTSNYRTNLFGFPASPAITNSTERNLALLDQRAGLAWVQDNIAVFGGDKTRVTIFGESAGGQAVDGLVTSYTPDQPRPFHAAIMESGTYAFSGYSCAKDDFSAWNFLTSLLSCNGTPQEKFDCVKNNKTKEILRDVQEKSGVTFRHTCDDKLFVPNPRARLEAKNVANVPVLLGTNTADGSFYTFNYSSDITRYFNEQLYLLNQAARNAILDTYKLAEFGNDEQLRIQQIHTDWVYHCPSVWYGEASSKFKPTYRYLFNATFANTRAVTPPETPWLEEDQGAYHSSEIQIAFSSYKEEGVEPGQKELSDAMRGAWAKFARNPTEAPLDGWVKVGGGGTEGKDVMSFGTDGKGAIGMVKDAHKCDLWKNLGFGGV